VADDARHRIECERERVDIGALRQMDVEDGVAVVGRKPRAYGWLETSLVESAQRSREPELQDLDRQRGALAEVLDQLRRLHEIRPVRRSLRHDLLAGHRAAAALDHAQRRVDLIRAIDQIVDVLDALHREDAQPEPDRERLDRVTRGNAHDLECLDADSPRERLDRSTRGAPGTKPDDHPGRD
jgi:hypothetical protein